MAGQDATEMQGRDSTGIALQKNQAQGLDLYLLEVEMEMIKLWRDSISLEWYWYLEKFTNHRREDEYTNTFKKLLDDQKIPW